MVAASSRSFEALKWLVSRGAGRYMDRLFRGIGEKNTTALMFACSIHLCDRYTIEGREYNDPRCALLLIEHGASLTLVDKEGRTAADLAKYHNLDKIAALFPLRDIETTKAFEADPLSPKMKFTHKSSKEVVIKPIGDCLCGSARRGELESLKKYSQYLKYLDSDGRNILMSACAEGKEEVCKWILDNFKEEEIRNFLESRDDFGSQCIHFASSNRSNFKILKLIVEALEKRSILDINSQDIAGFTPLHTAIGNGKRDEIEYLIKKGASAAYYSAGGEFPQDRIESEDLRQFVAQLIEEQRVLAAVGAKTDVEAAAEVSVGAGAGAGSSSQQAPYGGGGSAGPGDALVSATAKRVKARGNARR
jgi:ankyrin repeat protein